jgi:hypothetical protein
MRKDWLIIRRVPHNALLNAVALLAILQFENGLGAARLSNGPSSGWGGAAFLLLFRQSDLGRIKGQLIFPRAEMGKLRILLK